MRAEQSFKDIFPHGDFDNFLHLFKFWKDIDIALWCYGEIRKNEYMHERAILKEELKV